MIRKFLRRLFVKQVSGRKAWLYCSVYYFLFTLPIVAMGVFNYSHTYHEMTKAVEARKKAVAFLAASVIHERLDSIVNRAVSLVTRPVLIEEVEKGNWPMAMAQFNGVRHQFPDIDSLYLFNKQGVIKDTMPVVPSVIGRDGAAWESFRKVKKQWRSYISPVEPSLSNSRINVVSVLAPVKAKGVMINRDSSLEEGFEKVLALLQVQIKLESFSEWLVSVDAGDSAFVYLVDQKGQIVYHPKFSSKNQIVDFSKETGVADLLKGLGGLRLYSNADGREDVFLAYASVPAYGWGVVLTQPSRVAFRERDRELRRIVSMYGLALLMAIALASLILYSLLSHRRYTEKISQLMRAVEQSPAAIVITDIKGNMEYVNPKFLEVTGYDFEEVIGKNPRILKSGSQSQSFYKELWRVILSGQEWHGEFHNKKKDGTSYWENASISPVKDDAGQIINFIAVKEDVTERKRMAEKLSQAMAIKSEFTSVVSHELRTPLGPIKEGAGIILDGLVGEINADQRELLTIVKQNADRLHRLIDNVLDFQKLESGHMPFDFRENSIEEAVQEVCRAMTLVARQKQLDMVVDVQPGLPLAIFDRDKIVQVLTNLINNAIKFTDSGRITIRAGKDENNIHVVVEDTGPGMNQEDLPRLFQSFQQLPHSHRRKTGGTGLGLAICREIISHHHGRIWAESQIGKGASFHFILPINKPRPADA